MMVWCCAYHVQTILRQSASRRNTSRCFSLRSQVESKLRFLEFTEWQTFTVAQRRVPSSTMQSNLTVFRAFMDTSTSYKNIDYSTP